MPKWIVDIGDISIKDDIKDYLIKLWVESHHSTENVVKTFLCDFIYAEIPTVNGIHLITKPFNTQEFRTKFPDVDVHKNNGTLLYYPNSLGLSKYCCSICGGTNIQLQAWVDPNNNNKYIEDITDECWCEDCKMRTKIKKD